MKPLDAAELALLAALWGASFLFMRMAAAEFGVAYQLYFRLMARLGPANAISVTFLIPLFAVLWGWMFLGESVTPPMLPGGAMILLGTALATGVLGGPAPKNAAAR